MCFITSYVANTATRFLSALKAKLRTLALSRCYKLHFYIAITAIELRHHPREPASERGPKGAKGHERLRSEIIV